MGQAARHKRDSKEKCGNTEDFTNHVMFQTSRLMVEKIQTVDDPWQFLFRCGFSQHRGEMERRSV